MRDILNEIYPDLFQNNIIIKLTIKAAIAIIFVIKKKENTVKKSIRILKFWYSFCVFMKVKINLILIDGQNIFFWKG